MTPFTARIWLLLMIASATGCATLTSYQSARPLDDGGVQIALEPGYLLTRSEHAKGDVAAVSASVRIGVHDCAEVGIRVGNVRPELMAKFLLAGVTPDDVAVSIAPTLGGFWFDTGGEGSAQIYSTTTLLIGIPAGEWSEVVLGPKFELTWGTDLDTEAWAFTITPAVFVAWFIRAHRHFAIVPEIVVAYPLLHAGTGGPVVGGGFALQAGIGLVIGGEKGL